METEIDENEYKLIKDGILNYGLNIAFLTLYEFEKFERYEECHLLNDAIKKYHEKVNRKYEREPEKVILERYSSSENMQNSLIAYRQNFRNIFLTIHGTRLKKYNRKY